MSRVPIACYEDLITHFDNFIKEEIQRDSRAIQK